MLEELFGFGTNVIIKNCKNSGSISSTYTFSTVGTIVGIGGIVGACYSDKNVCDKINNCQNTAKITGKNCVGGIAGNISSQGAGYDIISNCSNTGAISGDDEVGGILGSYERYDDVSIKSEIFNCFNSANISGKTGCGGILGSGHLNNTEVKNIYNTGNITGGDSLGGIIGESSMSSSTSGDNIKGEVCNFYNKGSIKATEKSASGRIGGIVGSNGSEYIDFYNGYNTTINISDILGYGAGIIAGQNMGNITNVYYLEITGMNACYNQFGTIKAYKVTESAMKNSQSFVNKLGDRFCLDETNINNGYPILIWMVDKTAPSLNINYSQKEMTNENVVVTITANETIQEVEGWILSSDKKTLSKEYSENTVETIVVKDLAENETQETIEIMNIDNVLPEVNVTYSTKNPTKENVTVTITSNEEVQGISGWALTNKKILTKQYSANTKETITVKDLAGNEVKVNIEITNIDKLGPSCYVEYSTRVLTKDNVMVTIMANEQIEEVTGWTLSSDKMKLTKEYEQNTNQIITIKDLAGNEEKVNVKITNIDKTGPSVSIGYNTKNPTKENVIVTITSNEEIQAIQGWTLSSDKKILTKEYTENTTETITIKDLVGNETQANISISNIDKTGPSVSIGYSTKNPTKENVKVTITSNEEMQTVQGWTLSSDKKILTKEYTENTTETITIKDLVGNETQANISISNIDKTGPSVSIGYSTKNPTKENVKVTITSNEEMQTVQGWTLSSDKKTLTREYTENTTETITVKDLAGNETKVDIEITNIDKTIVEITIGDMNQDGKVDVTDFLMLKRHLVAGNKTDWVLTGNSLEAADMNENGTVDITDMLMLKRVVVENM